MDETKQLFRNWDTICGGKTHFSLGYLSHNEAKIVFSYFAIKNIL